MTPSIVIPRSPAVGIEWRGVPPALAHVTDIQQTIWNSNKLACATLLAVTKPGNTNYYPPATGNAIVIKFSINIFHWRRILSVQSVIRNIEEIHIIEFLTRQSIQWEFSSGKRYNCLCKLSMDHIKEHHCPRHCQWFPDQLKSHSQINKSVMPSAEYSNLNKDNICNIRRTNIVGNKTLL